MARSAGRNFEEKPDFSGINLKNLAGLTLSGADLTRANLTRANLTRAHLSEAHLSEAHLTRAHLSEAHLSEAHLSEADLSEADLVQADLTRANLTQANLTRANLTQANLTAANLSEAVFTLSPDILSAYFREATNLEKARFYYEDSIVTGLKIDEETGYLSCENAGAGTALNAGFNQISDEKTTVSAAKILPKLAQTAREEGVLSKNHPLYPSAGDETSVTGPEQPPHIIQS